MTATPATRRARVAATLAATVAALAVAALPARAQPSDTADAPGARDSTMLRREPTALARVVTDDPLLGLTLLRVGPTARPARLILVNLDARWLWYVDGDTIRFATSVAVGRGTPSGAGAPLGRHATPRARFTVLRKDTMPVWVPPDWYFEEVAAERGYAVARLQRRDTLRAGDGSAFYVDGGDVMRRDVTGAVEPVVLTDSWGGRRELVVDDRLVVPPIGTRQRQYPHVLGPRRLAFRDGYAIHGTDDPGSIGRAASHGCLRLRNEDVLALFDLVPVGTPVILW